MAKLLAQVRSTKSAAGREPAVQKITGCYRVPANADGRKASHAEALRKKSVSVVVGRQSPVGMNDAELCLCIDELLESNE